MPSKAKRLDTISRNYDGIVRRSMTDGSSFHSYPVDLEKQRQKVEEKTGIESKEVQKNKAPRY